MNGTKERWKLSLEILHKRVQTALTLCCCGWCFCCYWCCCCCCCCFFCCLCYLFVLLMRWLFENMCQTKMKLKVSVKITEQNNCGKNHRKNAIRRFNEHLPYAVDVSVAVVIFLFLCCVDVLKITTKWKWKLRLLENLQNKRKAEELIVNTPSGDQTSLTLFCCCYKQQRDS